MNGFLQRCTIKELDPINNDIMLVCIIIGKQTPKRLTTNPASAINNNNNNDEDRAVWNFTIRDSPIDCINVSFWGNAITLLGLHGCIQIGDIVEIRSPRILVRRDNDVGEQYRPPATSPFRLVVNENEGSVIALSPFRSSSSLINLVHLPIKPVTNYTSLAQIERNIKQMNGQFADLFVVVRQIGASRFVNTRNGLKEVCNLVVFDKTSPGMGITLWEREYIHRSSFWKPRQTVLYMSDMRINYDSFSKGPKASMSMRTIVTENPAGCETSQLREYAKNAVLQSSTILDQITASIPDPRTIRTVMNIQQIYAKIDEITANTLTRVEDQQFGVLLFAFVSSFDLDGVRGIVSTRCSSCRSFVNEECICTNELCLVNSNSEGNDSNARTPTIETSFDIRIQLSDQTGALPNCRVTGKVVENMLECSAEEFLEKSDQEKQKLKWKYLLERCELRLMIWARSANPIITVISCDNIDVGKVVQHL